MKVCETLITNIYSLGWHVEDAFIQTTDNGLRQISGQVQLKRLGLQMRKNLTLTVSVILVSYWKNLQKRVI